MGYRHKWAVKGPTPTAESITGIKKVREPMRYLGCSVCHKLTGTLERYKPKDKYDKRLVHAACREGMTNG